MHLAAGAGAGTRAAGRPGVRPGARLGAKAGEASVSNVSAQLGQELIKLCQDSSATAENVRAFLEKGADIEAKDHRGMRALHYAACLNNISVVKALIKGNATVDPKEEYGKTPLALATVRNNYIRHNDDSIIRILVKAGADKAYIGSHINFSGADADDDDDDSGGSGGGDDEDNDDEEDEEHDDDDDDDDPTKILRETAPLSLIQNWFDDDGVYNTICTAAATAEVVGKAKNCLLPLQLPPKEHETDVSTLEEIKGRIKANSFAPLGDSAALDNMKTSFPPSKAYLALGFATEANIQDYLEYAKEGLEEYKKSMRVQHAQSMRDKLAHDTKSTCGAEAGGKLPRFNTFDAIGFDPICLLAGARVAKIQESNGGFYKALLGAFIFVVGPDVARQWVCDNEYHTATKAMDACTIKVGSNNKISKAPGSARLDTAKNVKKASKKAKTGAGDDPLRTEWVKFKKENKLATGKCCSMEKLLDLSGLRVVKEKALDVFKSARINERLEPKQRTQFKLQLSFMGNPGTGKTTVAKIFGGILHECGTRTATQDTEEVTLTLTQPWSLKKGDRITQSGGSAAEGTVLQNTKDDVTVRVSVTSGLFVASNPTMAANPAGSGAGAGTSASAGAGGGANAGAGGGSGAGAGAGGGASASAGAGGGASAGAGRSASASGGGGFGAGAKGIDFLPRGVMGTDGQPEDWGYVPHARPAAPAARSATGKSPGATNAAANAAANAATNAAANAAMAKAAAARGRAAALAAKAAAKNAAIPTGPSSAPIVTTLRNWSILNVTSVSVQKTVKGPPLFIKVDAKQLIRAGADKFKSTVESACGGVLFIKRAHLLDRSTGGTVVEDILDELANVLKERANELTIILAGPQDKIKESVYASCDAINSNIDDVIFEDFDEEILLGIWNRKLKNARWGVENPEICMAAAKRVAEGAGSPGFRNAHEITELFEKAQRRAQVGGSFKIEKPILCMEDVLGPRPSRKTNKALNKALSEFESRVGVSKEIREQISSMVDCVLENYNRRLRGKQPTGFVLNYVFLGRPGTGKTTFARLFGRILNALGLLTYDTCLEKKASEFIGSKRGQTENKTNDILDLSEGKVLIIDEAHQLRNSEDGKNVLQVIVGRVQAEIGRNMAVIMCGYEKEMDEMFRLDPGLRSRFKNKFIFRDFTNDELSLIMTRIAKEEPVSVPLRVLRAAIDHLDKSRGPDFGNARDVKLLLNDAITKMRARRRGAKDQSQDGGEETLTIDDFGIGRGEGGKSAENPYASLDKLHNIDFIKEDLSDISCSFSVAKRDGLVCPVIPRFRIIGNAGTGKTTVALTLAKIFYSMGIIPKDHCEKTSGRDLNAQYQGQTEAKVKAKMEAAQGGVLFIDEVSNIYYH